MTRDRPGAGKMTGDPAATGERGSWGSEGYVARWVEGDVLADALLVPRRLSAEIAADAGIEVRRILDLGSGTGSYLEVFLRAFPRARAVWADASEPMLERARERLTPFGDRVEFVLVDVRDLSALATTKADVVTSSRAIHHFTPDTIREVYRSAFDALSPGGFLFNLDHFAAPADWEARYRRIRPRFVPDRGDREPHEHDAPAQPLERHLEWLEAAGFEPPDVPWRLFYTALVAARRPAEE
jgi:ubiquinone/menaquinone biosynthesis C-methylase UbiE